ncbi:MAG: DUF3180 domain-containing protein [Corynebacterium sp.]|nr:DUF3180 domain-containing protein [Corynebacterium sp.]
MKRTSIPLLIGVGVFLTLAVFIVVRGFYGHMMAIPATVSLPMWAVAVLCGGLAWKVYSAKKDKSFGIGLDTSQLNPLTVAQFLVVGKAAAWTGTIVGSAYLGIALYVCPRVGELASASNDSVGVASAVLGGLAMAVAGVVLERHCEVPPPSDTA